MSKDDERLPETMEAWIHVAMIRLMARHRLLQFGKQQALRNNLFQTIPGEE
jgi:hypothetical protein